MDTTECATDLTSRVLVCEYSALVTREPGVGGEEALQTLRGPLHYLSSDRAEVGGGGGCWRCTQGCDHQAQADQLEKWRHPESSETLDFKWTWICSCSYLTNCVCRTLSICMHRHNYSPRFKDRICSIKQSPGSES